jgi:hypothetical protein
VEGTLSEKRQARRFGPAPIAAIGFALLLASPVLAGSLLTDPEPDKPCPDGDVVLTKYVTTVDTTGDPSAWSVSVEFTLEGSGSCELSLASYELPSGSFTLPQTLFDSDTGVFSAGTNVLTVSLPGEGTMAGCFSQYDFVFGPVIQTITGSDEYGDRQIRSRIVGSESCTASTPTPTPTQQVGGGTPTPTPEGGVHGGTGTPGASEVPDTSIAAPTGQTAPPLGLLGSLLGLSLIAYSLLLRLRLARD